MHQLPQNVLPLARGNNLHPSDNQLTCIKILKFIQQLHQQSE